MSSENDVAGPGDVDTGEAGLVHANPDDAAEVGEGFEPDDLVEGAAMEQEARDAGELRD